jgi:hypothetical protein
MLRGVSPAQRMCERRASQFRDERYEVVIVRVSYVRCRVSCGSRACSRSRSRSLEIAGGVLFRWYSANDPAGASDMMSINNQNETGDDIQPTFQLSWIDFFLSLC